MDNKLNIAWISFACCEDSTIMFAEVLNDYFFEFKKHFNFIDTPVLSAKRDQESPLDICFIEGASISPENADHMKKLRARSKKIVAIGSCACTGMPSAHRNNFDPDQLKEISHILEKFNYADTVEPVEAVIPVDAKVPGCPMDLNAFMAAVNGLLTEFGHEQIKIQVQY
jgi:sulfhydrogenase subunit delta